MSSHQTRSGRRSVAVMWRGNEYLSLVSAVRVDVVGIACFIVEASVLRMESCLRL